MPKFTDKAGRPWELEISIGDVPKLRELGLDVETVFDDPQNAPTVGRVEVLGRCLWHLCAGQAKAAGVEPEDFAGAIRGSVRFAAAEALEAAIWDFILPPSAATKAKERLTAERERMVERMFEAAPAGPGGSSGGGGS